MTDSFNGNPLKMISERFGLLWKYGLALASTCRENFTSVCVYFQHIHLLAAIKVHAACFFDLFRNIGNKKQPKVNCWFCNEDAILTTDHNHTEDWICPSCHQYNGFTEDGDYKHPIREQFDVKNYKTNTVCSRSDFNTAKTVLCDVCCQNQVLKVRQLAAFTPFSEASYDEEIDGYRNYLENVYDLCEKCQKRVDEFVSNQDQHLLKNMKSSHLELLKTVGRKGSKEQTQNMDHSGSHKPALPFIMFSLCAFTALLHVILLLRHMAASGAFGSDKSSYLGQAIGFLITVVPPRVALEMGEVVVSAGALLCVIGLFAVGKYSLYPEDAIHLLLWLFSMVTTTNTFAASLPGLSVSNEMKMAVSAVTLSVSLLCCLRSRQPRHFTAVAMHKKDMSHTHLASMIQKVSAESQHGLKRSNSGNSDLNQLMQHSSCNTLPAMSAADSEKGGPPQFENLRQDLESFSLGLGKKSGSTSSIRSLPAAVTSSTDNDMTPDSSTDHLAQRSVLSPSRLGFLSFDLGSSSRSSSSEFSRSPSPWSPVTSDVDSVTHPVNERHQVPQMWSSAFSLQNQNSSSGVIRPVVPCNSTCNHPSYTPPEYRSLFNNPTLIARVSNSDSNLGPCDSQTLGATPFEDINICGNSDYRQKSHPGHPLVSNTSFFQQCLEQPNTSDPGLDKKGPRRSQRIALFGRPKKPWPLKKSLSCNNAYDAKNLEKAGKSARSNYTDKALLVTNPKNSYSSRVSPLEEVQEPSDFDLDQNMKSPNSENRLRDSLDKMPHFPLKPQHQSHQKSQKAMFSWRLDKKKRPRNKMFSEFSDDEDIDGINDTTDRLYTGSRNDSSWKWILLGLVIGTSITTNVFLVSQGWLTQH